jgi:hypothetical protein
MVGESLTDVSVKLILRLCPSLCALELSFCKSITDAALEFLVEPPPPARSTGATRSGGGVAVPGSREKLDGGGGGAQLMGSRSRQMTSIRLCKGPALSAGFEALFAARPVIAGLTSLYVAECHALSDAALMSVAQNCCHLTSLNINWCWGLHDESVAAVLQANAGLATFEAAGVKKLTAEALACLLEPTLACPSLAMLDVRQCDFVDDAALVVVKRALVKAASGGAHRSELVDAGGELDDDVFAAPQYVELHARNQLAEKAAGSGIAHGITVIGFYGNRI